MNQIVPQPTTGEIMESVIVKGDLSKLTPEERSRYYGEVCRSVGLNPLTKPFEYILLNGKLQLYALRNCTDQLRQIHKVSVVDMSEAERDGIVIVTCKVVNGEGRTDMAKGAVALNGLKGEALCNAIMKAETKAKRRATLSICGLGWLDETEIESMPAARPVPTPTKPAIAAPADQSPEDLMAQMLRSVEAMTNINKLYEWSDRHAKAFARLSKKQQRIVKEASERRLAFLSQAPAKIVDPETGEISNGREKRAFTDMPRAQQAGILCNEPAFSSFLAEHYTPVYDDNGKLDAASTLRFACGVDSRRDLDMDSLAGGTFDGIVSAYRAWAA